MKFLKAVLNNISLKLISLLLAVLTWTYIAVPLYRETTAKEKLAPSVIKVTGEKQIVKRLPIYVNIEGTPAPGYQVEWDRIAINPSYSVVAGPSEVIKELSYIATDPVKIEGVNNNIRKNVKLATVPNCKIGYEGRVNVFVPIRRERRR